MLPIKIRVIKNKHGSAEAALRAWRKGGTGLWGHPIQLGSEKFHVYGLNLRSRNCLDVEFTRNHIVIVKRKSSGVGS